MSRTGGGWERGVADRIVPCTWLLLSPILRRSRSVDSGRISIPTRIFVACAWLGLTTKVFIPTNAPNKPGDYLDVVYGASSGHNANNSRREVPESAS